MHLRDEDVPPEPEHGEYHKRLRIIENFRRRAREEDIYDSDAPIKLTRCTFSDIEIKAPETEEEKALGLEID